MDIEIINETGPTGRSRAVNNIEELMSNRNAGGLKRKIDSIQPAHGKQKADRNQFAGKSTKPDKISQAELDAETDFLNHEDPFVDDTSNQSSAKLKSENADVNDNSRIDPPQAEKRNAFSVLMQQSKQFYSYSVDSKKHAEKPNKLLLNVKYPGGAGGGSAATNGAQPQSRKKYCPFYKKLPLTRFTVDAFKYGTIPNIDAYILSHFHSDHYGGMTSSFVLKHHVYTSKISANLIKLRICRSATDSTLHVLPPIGQTTMIDNVRVTTFDANHCPGALIFLFELPNGTKYVHCGDFRADPEVYSQAAYKALADLRPDALYLDTTYLDPKYDFLPQSQVVAYAARLASRAVSEDAGTLFVCGSYSIGKERVFMSMANAIKSKVFCYSKAKQSTLEALEWPELNALLVRDGNKAQVHVVPMNIVQQLGFLEKYLKTYERRFTRVIGIRPTGWTHRATSNGSEDSLDNTKPLRSGRTMIYNIPYSEHSSYSELRWFVKFVKPQKIVPTVNLYSAESRRKMNEHLCKWMAEVGAESSASAMMIDADIADADDTCSIASSSRSSYVNDDDGEEADEFNEQEEFTTPDD